MMKLTCIKQHLSNTWSSIYEKVKQLWGWVEKHFKRQKFEERNIKIIINIWRCTPVLTLSQFWEYDIEKPNLSKNLQGKKMKNVKILHVVPSADLPRQYIFMVCTKFVVFSSNWNSSKHFSFCLEAFKRYSWKTKSDNW